MTLMDTLITALQKVGPYTPIIFSITTFFTSVAAVLTGLNAIKSSEIQRRMVEATLFQDFNRRYKSQEMGTAIKELVDWYYADPQTSVSRWIRGLSTKDLAAVKVDTARRMVSTYFVDVARLRSEGFISKKFGRMIAGQQGLNVYYEIIAPMNLAQNRPETTRKTVAVLKTLYKSYEGGLYNPQQVQASTVEKQVQ